MALQLTELDAYVYQHIVPETFDIIYGSSPAFTRFVTNNAEDFTGNSRVQQPIIVGELNGDFMGRGEAVDISTVTTDAAITCDMKVAWVNISLIGFDAMNNDGDLALFNQVEMKFLNASLKMAKVLATNMYKDGQSSTGRSKYLNGFPEWYDDGNTYAAVGGQTRTDINGIGNGTVGGLNAYTATITSFTLAQLQTAYGSACWGADHPDMIVVTQNGWNLVWQATQPMTRYPSPSDGDLAQIGFNAFRFNAADVVIDRYLPSGSSPIGAMYGFNSKYVKWWQSMVPLFAWGWTGFKGAQDTLEVAGQFLLGSNIMVTSPRTGFKLLSTTF